MVKLVKLIREGERERRRGKRQKEVQREREREGERESSNSKKIILKDSSVRSIWICLTASPCYTSRERERETAH